MDKVEYRSRSHRHKILKLKYFLGKLQTVGTVSAVFQIGLSGKLLLRERMPGAEISSSRGGRDFPFPHRCCSEVSHYVSGSEVAIDVECVVDGAVGGDE